MAADVDGKWVGQVAGQTGGQIELTYEFKSDGDRLTGTLKSQFGERKLQDGKIEGGTVKFTVTTDQFPIYNTGTIAGDEMTLVEDINGDNLTVLLRRAR